MVKLLSLKEKCRLRGLNYQVISGRVKGGWSEAKALRIPSTPAMELVLCGIVINLKKYCLNKDRSYLKVLKLIYTDSYSLEEALKLSKKAPKKITKKRTDLKSECLRKGLDYHVVFQRIKTGWSKEDALSTPIKTKKPFILKGKEINLQDYCEKHNLDFYAVRNRYYAQKMSLEDAVDFTKGKFHKKYKLKGKVINLKQESLKRGLNPATVIKRINSGKTVAQALDS